MKIPALLTCLLAMLLAAVPLHRAHADEVNFDVFYNSLADDGDWYNTPEYGYVWQPFVAYKTDKWRPYSDGYWAQTDDGWTWVSYENFGWATYHYGRWTRLKDTGWVWVPGYDWGPGWVSWRTNDDYVGWAPLPPKVEDGVYEGRVVESRREQVDYNDVEPEEAGYGTNVDVQYDIGPANYCFVETRNFGAPVLGEVLLPPQQNFVFIERTRNVTNIYYRREHDRTVVFNNGPDFAFINTHVERPIPRLQLERRDDPGFLRDGLRGGGNPTVVRNGVLQVATPMIARQPMNFAQSKPVRVKQNLAQAQVVRGWTNAGADQGAVQRIREQYKQQAASAPARPANPIIPPAAPPRERDERAAGNTPPAPAGGQPFVSHQGNQPAAGAPHAPLTEEERLARRDARQKERDQRAAGQPAAPNAASTPAPTAQGNADQEKEARRAARQAARANGQPVPAAATPTAANPANADQDKEARRAARQAARANGQPAAPAAAPAEAAQPNADQDKEARRTARQTARANGQPTPTPEAAQPQANAQTDQDKEARRAARQQERAAQPTAPQAQPAAQAPQDQEARRAARQQEHATQSAQQTQQLQQAVQAQQEQDARRAARQQEHPAQPEHQPQQQERAAQPEHQPQQQGNPGRESHQGQPQPGKPGQTPTP